MRAEKIKELLDLKNKINSIEIENKYTIKRIFYKMQENAAYVLIGNQIMKKIMIHNDILENVT